MEINQAKNGKKMLINYTMNKSHFDYKCKQTDSCSFIMPSKPLFPNSTFEITAGVCVHPAVQSDFFSSTNPRFLGSQSCDYA